MMRWTVPLAFASTTLTTLMLARSAAGAEVHETTTFQPHLIYRLLSVHENKASAFYSENFGHDSLDQLYARFRMEKVFNFDHEVVIEPTLRTSRDSPEKMETIFEQAYVHSKLVSNLFLTAGKKSELEGSAFFVNPSDLLNEERDLFDELYQYEGKVFTRLTYYGNDWSLGLGYIPFRARDAKDGRIWVKGAYELGANDLRFQYTYHKRELSTFGLSAARFVTEGIELHWDGRYQMRQRTYTEYYRERTISCNDDACTYGPEDPSIFQAGGTRLIFGQRRTVVLEGIQNQSGLDNREQGLLAEDEVKLRLEGNTDNKPSDHLTGRRYAFAAYNDAKTIDTVELKTSALVNTLDASYYGQVAAQYKLSPLTSVEVQQVWFRGRAHTEFGERPYDRVLALIVRGSF